MNSYYEKLLQSPWASGSLIRALVFGALLAVTGTIAFAQESTTVVRDPLSAVQRFKQFIDAQDIPGMCSIASEPDSSGPLRREHYESTQASLEGLIKFWRGASFAYGNVSINDRAKIPSATVTVSVSQLKHSAVISLLRFGDGWYIRDVEIYFQ